MQESGLQLQGVSLKTVSRFLNFKGYYKKIKHKAHKWSPKVVFSPTQKKSLNDLPGYSYKIGIFEYIVNKARKLTFLPNGELDCHSLH